MKKITKETLPEVLTPEIIEVLVEMAMETPKRNFDWAEVSEVLKQRGQLNSILDMVEMRNDQINKLKWKALSKEEQENELKKREASVKSTKFSGNMGEPE